MPPSSCDALCLLVSLMSIAYTRGESEDYPMEMISLRSPFFAVFILASTASGQYPGPDGCSSGPCLNTIPCRHCDGTWSDSFGATWILNTNYATLNVTGSQRVSNPVSGCPTTTFQVSGSITLNGGVNEFTRGATHTTDNQ